MSYLEKELFIFQKRNAALHLLSPGNSNRQLRMVYGWFIVWVLQIKFYRKIIRNLLHTFFSNLI